jgi:hypothetical protein
LSHRYCYLPLSWKSWNWIECAVGGVRHPQHTQTCVTLHLVGGTLEYYYDARTHKRFKIVCLFTSKTITVLHSI